MKMSSSKRNEEILRQKKDKEREENKGKLLFSIKYFFEDIIYFISNSLESLEYTLMDSNIFFYYIGCFIHLIREGFLFFLGLAVFYLLLFMFFSNSYNKTKENIENNKDLVVVYDIDGRVAGYINSNSLKSEEEIRAELEAEIRAEVEAEYELRKQIEEEVRKEYESETSYPIPIEIK